MPTDNLKNKLAKLRNNRNLPLTSNQKKEAKAKNGRLSAPHSVPVCLAVPLIGLFGLLPLFEVTFFRTVQRCIKSDLRPYVPDVLIVYM